MADEPTEALVRKEISRARRILREDLVIGKLNKHFPDEPPVDGNPPAPPVHDPAPPPARKGVWWGNPET